MEILGTRWFARFARREGITDRSLSEAIARAEKGLVDADLGGGLIKQRVARPGQGKSGGYRTIIAYRARKRAVFLLGFAKSDRENIEPGELATAREIGAVWLNANAARIARGIAEGEIREVRHEQEEA
jgi:hypothetical protein